MPDSSHGAASTTRAKGGWFAPWNEKLGLTGLNVFVVCFLVSSARAAYAEPFEGRIEMTILIGSLAVAPVTWLLLVHPVIRRRAVSVRFLLGLLIAGAMVNWAAHVEDRRVAVVTVGALIGPAIALLIAHRTVRRNREELAERRHRELVEAAARAGETAARAGDEPARRQGSVRSRARRLR